MDPIKPTPFISEYFNILQNENVFKPEKVAAIYIEAMSTSAEVMRIVETVKPDFVFIDGDHTLKGALWDHTLVRDHAQIVVHQDISSQACPDTTMLWSVLKRLERREFDCLEFCDQYENVNGSFLGIGVMKRKWFQQFLISLTSEIEKQITAVIGGMFGDSDAHYRPKADTLSRTATSRTRSADDSLRGGNIFGKQPDGQTDATPTSPEADTGILIRISIE